MAVPVEINYSLKSSQSKQYTQVAKWSIFKKKLQAWKFVLLSWSIVALVIFYIHLGCTIFAIVRYGRGDHNGMQTMWTGDCRHASNVNTFLHVGISIMSNTVFSAGGYYMQCLLAPSRKEVDIAHRKSIWLHIGVPSFRNMKLVHKRKVLLWWLLAASTLLLQMTYVSATLLSLVLETNDQQLQLSGIHVRY